VYLGAGERLFAERAGETIGLAYESAAWWGRCAAGLHCWVPGDGGPERFTV